MNGQNMLVRGGCSNRDNNKNTPWPFWLKIAHAHIEKCISLMVKILGKFLLGRQVRRNRGAPPAPVVEYITPRARGDLIAKASGGVHLTRCCGDQVGCACLGVYCTRASSCPSANASSGVYGTLTSCVSSANASSGVHYTCARGVSSANASGGVCCTRARGVSRASVPSLSGCIGRVFA